MLVVDSSVWIDFFGSNRKPASDVLDALLDAGEVRIVVPDLVLFEVLRGFRLESEYRRARLLLETLPVESAGGEDIARLAADHYRQLRQRGITVRSGIDVLVAAFCIERDYALLHEDRDYAAFEAQRGLRGWPH